MIKILMLGLLIFVTCVGCTVNSNVDLGDAMICRENNIQQQETNKLPIFVNTYSYIQRNLTIESFAFVKKGTNVKELKEIIGEPNGLCGSGILRDYYVLSDRSVVVVIEDKNGVCALQQRKFDKEGNISKKWILSP